MLKVWFDALTPKQLLFFESMIERTKQQHEVLFTSRDYREATGLAAIRGLSPMYVGKHGGGNFASKLAASLTRASKLSRIVQKFSPDATVSFCSPEAARISFGLGIPHIGFCNAPHSEAVCRLSVPLLTKLLIPAHIPKRAFARYGLDSVNIEQYPAMDEFVILHNKPASSWDAAFERLMPQKKTILFRTYEAQASYVRRQTDMGSLLAAIVKGFPDCNVMVFGRYNNQIRSLKQTYGKNTLVLSNVLDSGTLLSKCDLFIGSGGTMTTEAVLRGVPSISYEAVPNLDEKYLVRKKALVYARTPARIVATARRLLSMDREIFQNNARQLLSLMRDPYDTLAACLENLDSSRM